jgi:hypothetical protein
VKKKLIKVLQEKLEKIREKQIRKKEDKIHDEPSIPEELDIDPKKKEPLIVREVIIRLKPLTDAAKEVITKEKKKNALLQFRLKVAISGVLPKGTNDASSKCVRDIIRVAANKWDLRQR